MIAAAGVQELARASVQRYLLLAGALLVTLVAAGSCWDSRHIAYDEGREHELERATAEAQRARHAATVAYLAERDSLTVARRVADSLEAKAAHAEARANDMSRFVRVASETTLAVQLTAEGPMTILSVPHLVTAYIDTLRSTIIQKDQALAARDTQAVRADTVIVTVDRVVHADSTVITSQADTVDAEKAERPRFGFRAGVATGVAVTLTILKIAIALAK